MYLAAEIQYHKTWAQRAGRVHCWRLARMEVTWMFTWDNTKYHVNRFIYVNDRPKVNIYMLSLMEQGNSDGVQSPGA